VYIDEEEDTVHYVHQSVKQYLFTANSAHLSEFDVEKLDRHLGFLCMTYLDFSEFKHQLTRADKRSNTRLNPIQLGLSRIHSHNGATNQIALKLLSRRHQLQAISARELESKIEALRNEFKSPNQIPVQHNDQLQAISARELESKIEALRNEFKSPNQIPVQHNEFHFHEYAETNWIYHTTLINSAVHQKIWNLFCRCMEDDDISAQKPWEPMRRDQKERSHNSTSVQVLIISGHLTLLVYIMQRQPHILTEEATCEILKGASTEYRFRFTHLIVVRGSSFEVLKYGVFFAAQSGCILSLNLSIQAGADVNTVLDDCSVLEAAAGGGHLEIVERLLSEKADFARPISSRGKTCLHLAAAGGHLEIIERLLMAAEKINPPGIHDKGGVALLAAAQRGHLRMVELLLAGQAVHHIPAHKTIGETALQGAAARGPLETVKEIFTAGAYVRYQDTIAPALEVAAEGGYLEIVERLLAARVNVESSVPWEVWGARAFHLAVIGGYWEIGERLLAALAKVAVPASGYDRGRALQAAAGRGHLEMVNVLLTDQVNFDAPAPGEMMETAITTATRNGHYAVARKLKQALLLIEQL
jgi:ankyrin repeat protein